MPKINHVILNLYGAAKECSMNEFNEHVLTLVNQVLHFDSATLLTASSVDKKLVVQDIHAHNQPIQKLIDRQYITTPDFVLMEAYSNKGSCILSEVYTAFKGYADMMDYAAKYEVAQSLVLISDDITESGLDLVSLWRAKRDNQYTDHELYCANLILPHLLQARAINRRLAVQDGAGATLSKISLVANLTGCLQFSENDAIRLIQQEWPEWYPPVLPMDMLNAFRSSKKFQYVGKKIVAHAEVRDNLLHIRIILTPPKLLLTNSEHEVALFAAGGMSYKEIAIQLDKSPATVRNQLHSIYSKLGVSNKTSLTSKLAFLQATKLPENP